MFTRQPDSIEMAKEQIIRLMENHGLMSVCFPGGSEEWIYQKEKFFSISQSNGIAFKKLKKHIKSIGDFRLYIFKDEIKLKVTPQKVVMFD